MTTIRIIFLFTLLAWTATANSSFRTYEADIGESEWQFSGNPLGCQLNHQVPFYGKANFHKNAGKKQSLIFNLSHKLHDVSVTKVATIQSLSPSWLPNQRSRYLGEVSIRKGNNIFVSTETAVWRLLNELEIGRFPTFRYQDFESIQDQVAVSLSAVGFRKPYDEFLSCLTTLVPYQLNELNKMTLRFDFDKSQIKSNYIAKLKALAAYAKFDPNVEVVFLQGYTDSKGSRGYNQKLAEKRIAAVKKLLISQGADDSKFKTIAFGEKNPVASNRKASGRALNRRVYLQVK